MLAPEQVTAIRERFFSPDKKVTMNVLAKENGISVPAISNMINRKTYVNVQAGANESNFVKMKPIWKCEHCGKKFKFRSAWQRHTDSTAHKQTSEVKIAPYFRITDVDPPLPPDELADILSHDQLSKVYHKLALQKHPDKGGCVEDFKRLQQQYQEYRGSERRWKLEAIQRRTYNEKRTAQAEEKKRRDAYNDLDYAFQSKKVQISVSRELQVDQTRINTLRRELYRVNKQLTAHPLHGKEAEMCFSSNRKRTKRFMKYTDILT
jgi:hypothetical protein